MTRERNNCRKRVKTTFAEELRRRDGVVENAAIQGTTHEHVKRTIQRLPGKTVPALNDSMPFLMLCVDRFQGLYLLSGRIVLYSGSMGTTMNFLCRWTVVISCGLDEFTLSVSE